MPFPNHFSDPNPENDEDSQRAKSVRELIESHNRRLLQENGLYPITNANTYNGRPLKSSMEYFKEENGDTADQRPPSVSSNLSTSKRIRKMQIPTQNADVDKFLDDVFQQVRKILIFGQNVFDIKNGIFDFKKFF